MTDSLRTRSATEQAIDFGLVSAWHGRKLDPMSDCYRLLLSRGLIKPGRNRTFLTDEGRAEFARRRLGALEKFLEERPWRDERATRASCLRKNAAQND